MSDDTRHVQTTITLTSDVSFKVDKGIAPLIRACWKCRIWTIMSCEGDEGTAWICFASSSHADRFLANSLPAREARSGMPEISPDQWKWWTYEFLGEEFGFGPQVSVRFPNELITPLEKNLVIASTAPRQGTGLIWNFIAQEEKT